MKLDAAASDCQKFRSSLHFILTGQDVEESHSQFEPDLVLENLAKVPTLMESDENPDIPAESAS